TCAARSREDSARDSDACLHRGVPQLSAPRSAGGRLLWIARGSGVGSCEYARMAPLSAKDRAQLPDSAFAYIDSGGRRRLPINDAAHVRNALSRFSQVVFEDEA